MCPKYRFNDTGSGIVSQFGTEARVLAEMVRSGAPTRAELAQRLGLSKASLSRATAGLLSRGFIHESGLVVSGGPGRRTSALAVRPDLGYILGGDIEGMGVRACLIDCTKTVVASTDRPVGAEWSMDRIVCTWIEAIEEVLAGSGVPARKVIGLGVGLPGLVSRDSVRFHAYLPPGRWVDVAVGSALGSFGLPISAANNVICVSEYERRLGLARGHGSFIALLVRYGIGAAVYAHGELIVGEQSFTGELGHMRLDPHGPRCICGGKGCLDVFASGRTLPPEDARSGDIWDGQLVERARWLGVGLANLLKVYHPPLVILNGIYNAYAGGMGPALEAALGDELTPLGIDVPELVFGSPVVLKADVGAALRAADAFAEPYFEALLVDGHDAE
ncbi:MAG: ROK family transcriptional regulator [Lentisphaerae bacterium]|jgi:predicted NBD/HSP70 family sugar kinase|nr:ROK family transcriptional regulator [Lentisphaerota bacterium]MBT5611855.1 ROK family transcriptional regulator [Lentisphaerota bacterium]MBT7059312.1 ROK family transcriptional regulator [Lentisphaerota bacterium]MBT7843835.1 ROK family transcriptional regulator [Lentisphaerota bacterium]